jgi:hypothetical protein
VPFLGAPWLQPPRGSAPAVASATPAPFLPALSLTCRHWEASRPASGIAPEIGKIFKIICFFLDIFFESYYYPSILILIISIKRFPRRDFSSSGAAKADLLTSLKRLFLPLFISPQRPSLYRLALAVKTLTAEFGIAGVLKLTLDKLFFLLFYIKTILNPVVRRDYDFKQNEGQVDSNSL